MNEIKPANRRFYRATILLRSLYKHGLRHAVISPGSRSTPITMAAAALPQLQKHVILDERSAAFTALGIGKSTGHPAALICTSGTAVANYFPAVIEARKSGVPLLLLTADRPAELHGTGANQTIDQQKIYGDYPVFFHSVSESEEKNNDEYLQRLAGQSLQIIRDKKGPAHLNIPFSKPLEPDEDFVQSMVRENKSVKEPAAVTSPQDQVTSFRFDDDLLDEIVASSRPLIVTGQLAAHTKLKPIFRLAERLEAPVLSEHGMADLNYAIQGFEGFLRNDNNANALEPDLILRFGREPASKSLLLALKKWHPNRHVHFSDTGQRSDIQHTTTDFIDWNGNYFDASKFTKRSTNWLEKWKKTESDYFEAVDHSLAEKDMLTDAYVYHHLAPQIPAGWSVFFSNSFPARDRSMIGRWKDHPMFTNRGVSGIDGITSTAIGLSIGGDQPGILFTGDLAFLHDTNALLNDRLLQQPLVVVVINNEGGSIFRMLPIVNHKSYFEPYFETPQQADIAKLAESYGIQTTTVTSLSELEKVDLSELINHSRTMLQVIECQTNTEQSMELRKQLWQYQIKS